MKASLSLTLSHIWLSSFGFKWHCIQSKCLHILYIDKPGTFDTGPSVWRLLQYTGLYQAYNILLLSDFHFDLACQNKHNRFIPTDILTSCMHYILANHFKDVDQLKTVTRYWPGKLFLFHTMACFYVIYWYVFSEWRSIKPVVMNQYDITMG